jgi:hypothetical protein
VLTAGGAVFAVAGARAVKEQPAQAGPLGLFIIILLGVATILLVRSMSKHLRRLPPSFDPPDSPDSPGSPHDAAETDDAAGADAGDAGGRSDDQRHSAP